MNGGCPKCGGMKLELAPWEGGYGYWHSRECPDRPPLGEPARAFLHSTEPHVWKADKNLWNGLARFQPKRKP